MDPDGSNKTNLTNTVSTNYGNPAWSPDRSKIAFNSDKDDGSGEIYVMNADGSNMVRLTNFVGESDVEPAWSPDGNKLAFASRRDHLISSIYVMDSETGADVIRVTNAGTGSDQGPSWSSGNRIAFWTNEGSIGLHIGIVDVNPSVPFDAGEAGAGVWGTNRTGLLSNLAYGLNPAWSPDGTKIVYSAGTGTRHIGIMNADGTGQVDLTGGTLEDFPSFSPDGTRIAFDRNVSGKVLVHTMNVNGSNQTVLTESDAGPGGTNPGW
ncbi:MAG: PD40 domain-containing protein [Myxococcales bacterium]|nr:PD40 domain-containing protein [Myxococcales bacterium]